MLWMLLQTFLVSVTHCKSRSPLKGKDGPIMLIRLTPRVFRLLRLASHCHRERQVVPKVAPHLVDTTRNVVLIGDAGIPGPVCFSCTF